MIKNILGIAFFIAFSAIALADDGQGNDDQGKTYRNIPTSSFRPGEKLTFKIHYGWLNAGKGIMQIDKKIHHLHGRPCYRVNIDGFSTGMFDMMLRIRDTWGTYLDTAAIVPHRFYRHIEEGDYRKHEAIEFNHKTDTATAIRMDKHTQEVTGKENFSVPNNVQDLVSGYYYLRTINYDKLEVGDIVKVDAFFEDEIYDFKVRYMGKEPLRTSLGKINAIKLVPIMPKNSLFKGKDAITAWLSDDEHKIPLKVKAKMFVGAVEIDIINHELH